MTTATRRHIIVAGSVVAYVLVLVGLALTSVLLSDAPPGQELTMSYIALGTIGWTYHFAILSSPVVLTIIAIAVFMRWRKRRTTD